MHTEEHLIDDGYVPVIENDYTLTMPTSLPNWKYIQRALSRITKLEDLNVFYKSLLTSDKDKEEQKCSITEIAIIEALDEPEMKVFKEVLPTITSLASHIDTILSPPPVMLLSQGTVLFTRRQCASLIAAAVMGLFSTRLRRKEKEFCMLMSYPYCFLAKENVQVTRGKALINYFHNVHTHMNDSAFMNEIVTIQKHRTAPLNPRNLLRCKQPLCLGEVTNDRSIMSYTDKDYLKADFANKYIGGGVLCGGCVQEEIMFMECPEATTALFVLPVMDDLTTCRIKNIRQYTKIGGYGRGIKVDTDLGLSVKPHTIVALDAQVISFHPTDQFSVESSLREMNKVYSAVSNVFEDEKKLPPFVTGKWGCGAFGGNPEYKYLLQCIICSYVKRPMIFTTFHDEKLFDAINQFKTRIEADPPTVGNFICWLSYIT